MGIRFRETYVFYPAALEFIKESSSWELAEVVPCREMTMTQGVERAIKNAVPEVKKVLAV